MTAISLKLPDNLHVESYAMAEHCRSISIRRMQPERLAQLDPDEIKLIIHKLQRLIGV